VKNQRIGVLMGGPSSERAVSLNTGRGVHAALLALGYDAVALDWTGDLATQLRTAGVEVVWNALHGTLGEDGSVQGFCEVLGLPYTGSGVLASALAMDKVAAKRLFAAGGLTVPAWRIVTSVADCARCHGVTLCEQYIKGREISVGILDDEPLGTVEIRPAIEFYDYEAKYHRADTQYLCPAPVPADLESALRVIGLRAHQALGCASYSRVDLLLSDAGEPFVLEVNTLPGMTEKSLIPKMAAHAGLSYAVLCERILAGARVESMRSAVTSGAPRWS
jgi:D-alanine-D-alanine ligase